MSLSHEQLAYLLRVLQQHLRILRGEAGHFVLSEEHARILHLDVVVADLLAVVGQSARLPVDGVGGGVRLLPVELELEDPRCSLLLIPPEKKVIFIGLMGA